MKAILAIFTIPFIMFAGCSSARFYHDADPLPFENIDYGFPMRSGSVNGTELAWHDSGGEGDVLLLVHGLASNAGFWRYNLPDLRAAGYRVIAVDLPGYGKSGKAYSTPYGMKYYAATLDALLASLNISRATVVGHSMGAQIAMTMVLEGSSRVQKLILLSPAGIERFKDGEGRWLKGAVTPEFVINTPETAIRANLAANFYCWRDQLEWMVEERARMAKVPEFERFAYAVSRSVAAMIEEAVWMKLGEIHVPTVIIAGEHDNLIPNPYLHGGRTVDVMRIGEEAIPQATLHMVPDAGHMLQIERPEAVNRLIIENASAE
ncbi:MAG: alpha/beta hydrolase [Bacteroidota bacterium]|nr:alpha/beta hydrolase [Bacteroidota bacterium]